MMLNDALIYVQIFKSSFDQLSIQTVGHPPPIGVSGEDFTERM